MANKKNSPVGQKTNKIILGRTLVLLVVCGIVAFIVLAISLYNIMVKNHEYYEQLAVEQQTRETTVTASRGTIYDSDGNVLAMSATAYTVFISPYEMQQYEEDTELIAKNLSEILEVDYDSIMEKTTDVKSWYKTVAKKIEPEVADEVRAFKSEYDLKSVHIETDSKRYYPNSSLACHIVGFVGDENYGLEGIEAYYNQYLEGVDGSVVRLKSANGTDLLYNDYENFYDAEDGSDVKLTIKSNVQYYVEKHLKQAIEDYDVQNGGCCIVMDVNTGAILAMTSMDNYDLNDYLTVSQEKQEQIDQIEDEEEKAEALKEARLSQWRNKAINDTYEPGSVFKIITLAMALEEGVVSKNDSFYCGGSMNVLGRTDPLHCWKRTGHGSQTLVQAVQHSCNCAFCSIGLKVGAETFYKYAEAFGLFDKSGIDISGEASSIWWDEDIFFNKDNLSQLASASFGQTFNVTPLQVITAISAAVNGGNLMEPYIVSNITDSEGETVYSKEPTAVRQVISEETSKTIREILEAVVGEPEGTGKNAYVAGYRVGGKTGTSEKTAKNAVTGEKEYIVSFCGVAPANDPQIAVLLLLDNPSNDCGVYVSGGAMAAPVVGRILADVLPELEVEPQYTDSETKLIDVKMPYVTGNSVDGAKAELESLGLSVKVVGEGDKVTDQLPLSNYEIAAGTEVIIYAGQEKPEQTVAVPDIKGLSVSSAKERLASVGLFLDTSGASPINSGVIVSTQSIVSGTEVAYGTVVEATLIDPSNQGRY